MTTTQAEHNNNSNVRNRSTTASGYPSSTRHYSPTLGIYMHNGESTRRVSSVSPVNYCARTTSGCGENFQNVCYSAAHNDGSTQDTSAATHPSFAQYSSNINHSHMRIMHDSTNAKQNIVVPTVLRPNAAHRDGNETQYASSAGHHIYHPHPSNGSGSGYPRNCNYHDHRAVSRSSRAMQQKHCHYAHRGGFGPGRRLRNDKYKTEMCIDFMYGRCRRGRDKCHFAHGENDLMPVGSSSQMPSDCTDRGSCASFQLCSNARAFVPASAAARSGQSIQVMQAVSDFKDVTGGGGRAAPMVCPMAPTTTMAARSDKNTKQSISTPFNMFVVPQMPSNVFFESIDHASSSAASEDDELPLPRPTSDSSSALPSNPWSLKGSSSGGSREWSPVIGPPKQPPGFAEHCDKAGKPSSTSPSGVDADLEDDDYFSMLSDLNCLDLGEERQSSVFFERH